MLSDADGQDERETDQAARKRDNGTRQKKKGTHIDLD